MKNCFLSILALLSVSLTFSQSDEDYTNTLDFIKESFNEKKTDLIYNKFQADLKTKLEVDSFNKTMDSLYAEKGTMQSYEYLMEEDNEKSFLVDFESASMLMLIYLTPDGEISTFKITEY